MNARKVFAARATLPVEVSAPLLPYLALFRPDKRALSWSRTLKVMQELAALIAPGWVQVQGKPARECPPPIWAAGMAQMVERAATLQRPLKNHNYLRQVVWQLADQATPAANGPSTTRSPPASSAPAGSGGTTRTSSSPPTRPNTANCRPCRPCPPRWRSGWRRCRRG